MTPDARTELFENTPIRKAAMMQIIPSVLSQLVTLVYNLADTFFVGMLNDPAQLGAITVVTPTFVLINAFANLFGIGGASLISRLLGQRKGQEAASVSTLCITLGTFAALIYALFTGIFAGPLLTLCGADANTMVYARQYAFWVLTMGSIPSVMNMLLASLIRAEGQARVASMGVSLGAVLNILLDPFFILPQFLGLGE